MEAVVLVRTGVFLIREGSVSVVLSIKVETVEEAIPHVSHTKKKEFCNEENYG